MLVYLRLSVTCLLQLSTMYIMLQICPFFDTNFSLCIDEVLEQFRHFQEGPDPSRKLRENVGGKIYRIKKFLAFMAEGKSNLSQMVFLNETKKIHM